MTKRYEVAYGAGPEGRMLVFPEGAFEALPFEIRLMEPWYGCDYLDPEKLKPAQRHDMMRQGFILIRENEYGFRDAA